MGMPLGHRFETCYQIALAIKKEVEDLEAGGIQVCYISFLCLVIISPTRPCGMCKNALWPFAGDPDR